MKKFYALTDAVICENYFSKREKQNNIEFFL